ncbi:MAG: TIGR03620 family F420-dependent LLM class oxidoreductase [Patulibacter minatonensis]
MPAAPDSPTRDDRALRALRERRVGIWTSALDAVSPAAAARHAAEIEALGYGSLFFGEAYGREAFTNAAQLLGAGERLIVGTGIANIYGRDATTGNAASRTLHDAFPGRFVAGWGVSHAPLVERLRGHDYGKPLTAARTYLEALDAATFAAAGEPFGPPRLLAALRPKMLALSASHADGALPYLVTPEHTRRARAELGPEAMLVVEQGVVLTDDEAVFRERAHWHLEIYTGLPNYRNSWIDLGFAEADAVRGGSDRLKEALVAWGDADRIAERVREHLDAGADHVVIQALGAHVAEVPADQWRALAPALTAL